MEYFLLVYNYRVLPSPTSILRSNPGTKPNLGPWPGMHQPVDSSRAYLCSEH